MRAHARTEDARAVLEWIGTLPATAASPKPSRQRFTLRDVYRSMHRRFETAADALAALSFLEDHGYVRHLPDLDRRPGRKPVAYEVHPKAVTR